MPIKNKILTTIAVITMAIFSFSCTDEKLETVDGGNFANDTVKSNVDKIYDNTKKAVTNLETQQNEIKAANAETSTAIANTETILKIPGNHKANAETIHSSLGKIRDRLDNIGKLNTEMTKTLVATTQSAEFIQPAIEQGRKDKELLDKYIEKERKETNAQRAWIFTMARNVGYAGGVLCGIAIAIFAATFVGWFTNKDQLMKSAMFFGIVGAFMVSASIAVHLFADIIGFVALTIFIIAALVALFGLLLIAKLAFDKYQMAKQAIAENVDLIQAMKKELLALGEEGRKIHDDYFGGDAPYAHAFQSSETIKIIKERLDALKKKNINEQK